MIALIPLLLLAADCTEVAGERILGADMARAVPAMSALPADFIVGYAPQPGTRRVFDRDQLSRLGREHNITGDFEPICFISPMVQLTDAAVLEAMQSSIEGVNAEIQDVGPRSTPPGRLVMPASGLQGQMWRGYILYNGTRRFPVIVRAKVTQRVTRVVAVEAVPAGQPITAGQLKVETVDIAPTIQVMAKSIEEVEGRLARRSLTPGTTVMVNDLTTLPDIAKGDRVQVQVLNGASRLILDAQAQAQGRAGDTIPVRNLTSGRNFLARVEGPGKVVLNLKGNQ